MGDESPSPRRAWIEMLLQSLGGDTAKAGRPPHGGRGLKFAPARDKSKHRLIVALPTEGVD